MFLELRQSCGKANNFTSPRSVNGFRVYIICATNFQTVVNVFARPRRKLSLLLLLYIILPFLTPMFTQVEADN